MGTVLLLATEASQEGGFGLNFNLLETNLINLGIVIWILYYFGKGILGKTLGTRRQEIAEAIKEAEDRQKEAAAALADQQQKLAQAQAEAEKIRAQAEENAKAMKEAIVAKSEQDIERLRQGAARDLDVERDRAIAELRQRVAAMALERVESRLKTELDENRQRQLIDRSIATLGGNG